MSGKQLGRLEAGLENSQGVDGGISNDGGDESSRGQCKRSSTLRLGVVLEVAER